MNRQIRKKNFLFSIGLTSILFTSCAIFTKFHPYEYLQTTDNQNIIVSKEEPSDQFICSPLGFLPCSFNNQTKEADEENFHMQCAQNIQPYAQNIEANYIYIQEPIKILGISWRDAKANLFKCKWLPQLQVDK